MLGWMLYVLKQFFTIEKVGTKPHQRRIFPYKGGDPDSRGAEIQPLHHSTPGSTSDQPVKHLSTEGYFGQCPRSNV